MIKLGKIMAIYIYDKKSHSSLVGMVNILKEGLRNISAGTVDYTDGADVRPHQGQSAMKSEAQKYCLRVVHSNNE